MRIAGVFTLICSAILGAEDPPALPDEQIVTPSGPIRVTDLRFESGFAAGSSSKLTGTLVNETGPPWKLLVLDITRFDSKGMIVGSARFEIKDLAARQRKDFSLESRGFLEQPTARCKFEFFSGKRAPRYAFELTSPARNTDLQFADQFITWAFAPLTDGTAVAFSAENKSGQVARLNWNEASYVDTEGIAHRIASGNTRVMDLNAIKPPTIIPSNSTARETIVITENVRSSKDIVSMLPDGCPGCRSVRGKEFRLLMPVDIGSIHKDYTFRIRIVSVE